jgi:coatomer subunit beta
MKAQADEVISFGLLVVKKEGEMSGGGGFDQDLSDISRATGSGQEEEAYVSKLDRITPLTGYSDPIYAEAYIHVQQFDILMGLRWRDNGLDVLIVNQTKDTLQNLTLEFTSLGDLKLVEKPASHSIGPHGFHSFKVNFKVSRERERED